MPDLRISSGFFFVLVGLILTVLGIFDPGARARLTDANVNLYTGLFMMAFGGFLLLMARRAVLRSRR